MKRVIYLFQFMLIAAMVTSCEQDQLKNATDVVTSPVYNLHTNTDGTIFTSDDGAITNIYVYTEVPKVSESQSSFDANIHVYAMEDFIDNTTDDYYDFSYTRVETLYEEDEDGNEVATGEYAYLKYVVWGYRDRTPYLLWGDDTPDDYSDDVYTRGELYVKVYDMDDNFLWGSQTQEDDSTTNKTNFASNGLKIFEEYRTIDSGVE